MAADVKPTKGDNIKRRQELERMRSKLLEVRSSWDSHWRDLNDYILPRRTRFMVDDENQDNRRRSNKIIDSTATRAARTLQSGLHSGLTSPARPWLKLTTPDPDLAEAASVKQWLHTVTTRLLNVFLKSNMYNVLPTLYGDLGVFGTPAMSILQDDKEVIRGYSYPIGSFAIGVSRRQVVDTFLMDYKMTVRQIVEEFGFNEEANTIDWSNISNRVKNLWDKGNTENMVDVVWFVGPNTEADPDRGFAMFKSWASLIWERGGNEGKFLQNSGFDDFPMMVPRWHCTGFDWYASSCPGIDTLSDIRALQVMQRRKAQAVEKAVNPPLQAPDSLANKRVSLRPAEVTFLNQMQMAQGHKIIPIHEVNLNGIRFLTADIQDTRAGIKEGFFTNLFLMLSESDRRQITAREVAEKHEEKLLVLGPVLERLNDELLDPAVDRTYGLMDRAGLIPPPPKELEGVALKVEYVSILSQAQKMVGISSIDRFIGSTVQVMQAFPDVRFKIDPMAIIDDYAEMYGVNPKFVIPTSEAKKAVAAAAQQQAQAAKMAAAEQASKTAKNLSAANVTDDSMLGQLTGGASN